MIEHMRTVVQFEYHTVEFACNEVGAERTVVDSEGTALDPVGAVVVSAHTPRLVQPCEFECGPHG